MSASIVSGYAFGAGHLSPSLWKVETQYKSNGNVCHPNRWFFSSPPSVFFRRCKNYPRVLGPWIHHHIFTKGFSYILKGSIILDSGNVLHLKGVLLDGELMVMFGGAIEKGKFSFLEWSLIWIIIFLWVKSQWLISTTSLWNKRNFCSQCATINVLIRNFLEYWCLIRRLSTPHILGINS